MTKATLHDELMREAGFEVAQLDERERRRMQRGRRLRRVAAFVGIAAAVAIVAGLEFLHGIIRSNGRIGGAAVLAGVVGVLLFLRALASNDDEESQS
jgi:hypothetical protein